MITRYVHFREDGRNYRRAVARWYLVVAKHLPNITFFAHRIPWKPSMWTVSEQVSGSRAGAGEHKTRHEAITAARLKFDTVNIDEFIEKRRRAINFLGGSVSTLPLTNKDQDDGTANP